MNLLISLIRTRRFPYQRLLSTSNPVSTLTTHSSVVEAKYKELISQNIIKYDIIQYEVVKRMDKLFEELRVYVAEMKRWQLAADEYDARLKSRIEELRRQEAEMPVSKEERAQPSVTWTSWLSPNTDGTKNNLTPDQEVRLRRMDRELRALRELGPSPSPPSSPKGLYIHGSVGSGKTRLMDLFYSLVASEMGDELSGGLKRVHFNSAMLSIHSRIHKLETQKNNEAMMTKEGEHGEEVEEEEEEVEAHNKSGIFRYWGENQGERNKASKLAFLAIRRHIRQARSGKVNEKSLAKANSQQLQDVAKEFILKSSPGSQDREAFMRPSLLAFDEVQILDPWTAATLKALFEGLTSSGCVLVLTSNRPPRELPRHGLHEAMFDNMIQTIEDRCEVVSLSSLDYRRMILQGENGFSMTPSGAQSYFLDDAASREAFEDQFRAIAPSPSPLTIPVLFGRSLPVARAQNGAAYFEFEELCANPLGPADYTAIASSFQTVFLSGVPTFNMNIKDQARRFITLIDELYNAKTKLVIRAAAEPDQLFSSSGGRLTPSESVVDLEGLQFEGAVEGGRLRRNVLLEGGVAPVASTDKERIAAQAHLGGNEERFAFARAISRLHEMTRV